MFVYEITFSPTGGRKRFRITLQNLLAGKACVGVRLLCRRMPGGGDSCG